LLNPDGDSIVVCITEDQELWACTNTVHAHRGENAIAFVASRIESLPPVGDNACVATWRMIVERLAQLTRGERQLD
jgi:hypothetical protein